MSTDNDLVRGDQIVTAGPSKLGANTGLTPQIPNLNRRIITHFISHPPNLECSVMAATDHPGSISQELG